VTSRRPSTLAETIAAWAAGQISARDAVRGMGASSFTEALGVALDHGHRPSHEPTDADEERAEALAPALGRGAVAEIAILEAAPLVALASAGALDLLSWRGIQPAILDVAARQADRHIGYLADGALATWLAGARRIASPLIGTYEVLRATEGSGDGWSRTRGFDEAATAWALANAVTFRPATDRPRRGGALLLTMDAEPAAIAINGIRCASLRTFLRALEHVGAIEGVAAVFSRMAMRRQADVLADEEPEEPWLPYQGPSEGPVR